VTDNGDGTWSWSLATTDNGSGTVVVQASDGEHTNAEDSFGWSAANVAPTATALAKTSPIDEGGSSSLSLTSPTDVSSVDAASLHFSFACDGLDASLAANYAAASTTNSASCPFADNGSYTVKGRVYDKDGDGTTYSVTVVVNNVDPTVVASFAAASVSCGAGSASLNINISDPGVNDNPWAVTINWGDGSSNTTFNAATQGDQTAQTHTYASAGVYNATVSVTDKDGGSGSDTANAVTVNYNLSGILQPINDTRNGQPTSLFKYGSTIPVKVEVTNCDGSHPSNLVLKVTWKQGTGATPPGVDEVSPTSQADLGNTMRFSDPLYVLQLNSKNTTSDSSSGITIFVTIQSTLQTKQADIGFKK
jgi:hypothetical protein